MVKKIDVCDADELESEWRDECLEASQSFGHGFEDQLFSAVPVVVWFFADQLGSAGFGNANHGSPIGRPKRLLESHLQESVAKCHEEPHAHSSIPVA